MAKIFSTVVGGRGLDLWYHFAIMFEALFILTTIDAGTRVGRYLLQDFLGNVWKPLGDTKQLWANLFASVVLVAAWGYFLIQGVKDPLGGINSLWPLFGIANQLLAAIALCLATTVILKTHLAPQEVDGTPKIGKPAYALVTLIPLIWLLLATMTAAYQKIGDQDPRIGFLAKAEQLDSRLPDLQEAADSLPPEAQPAALRAINDNRAERLNQKVNAVVAGIFIVLVSIIVALSVREWLLLLGRKKLAQLQETEPVWLPTSALTGEKPVHLFGLFALSLALLKEVSGEAAIERERAQLAACECEQPKTPRGRQNVYLSSTERRFSGVTRCC